MELKINIIEAAAELAELRVIESFSAILYAEGMTAGKHFESKLNSIIYKKEDNGDTTYTEVGQEMFNMVYDQLFSKLIDCKTQELPDSSTKQVNAKGLVEKLAHEDVKKYFDTVYSGYPPEKISDMIWELGELNQLTYTKYAQRVYNAAEEKFLMHLMEFEL